MPKTKICLAIADSKAEEWLMEKIKEKDNSIEFTKPALHRSAVIDRVAFELPTILIISESLPEGGNSISFDALIKTIRTKYLGCRIIIMAGNHEIGDKFLSRMVSRGIYNIIVGSTVQLSDIVECVFEPKDYDYAEKLQGLEPSLGNDESELLNVNMVEVVETEKRRIFNRSSILPAAEEPQSDTLVNKNSAQPEPSPVAPPQEDPVDYGTSILKSPNPTLLQTTESETTLLSEEKKTREVPKGIIFERVGGVEAFKEVPNKEESQNVQSVSSYNANSFGSYDNKNVKTEYPVGNNKILRSEDNNFSNNQLVPAGKFLPKIVTFVGARQGVGCTTSVINTAYSLAYKGKRVAVIDAVWNEKSIFDKLRLAHTQNGFNNNINYPLPAGFVSSYAVKLPEAGSIQFLELFTGDVIPESILSTIRALSGYNYILIDMSIGYYNQFSTGLIRLSDKIVAVTVQDNYELMILKNYLNAFNTDAPIFNNLTVLLNKAEVRLNPTMEDVARFIGVGDVFMIPMDNYGFISANLKDGIYVNHGRKKITGLYSALADRIS